MSQDNSELHRLNQMGRDAADQARAVGQTDSTYHPKSGDRMTRRAALGPSSLPPEIAVAISLALLGSALGFAVTSATNPNPGIGLIVGAVIGVSIGLLVLIFRAPNRRQKRSEALAAAEAARRTDEKRRFAEAEASGAFDRFGKD